MLGINRSPLSHYWQIFVEPYETVYPDKRLPIDVTRSHEITLGSAIVAFISRDNGGPSYLWRLKRNADIIYSKEATDEG